MRGSSLLENLRIHQAVRSNAKAIWFSVGLAASDGTKQVLITIRHLLNGEQLAGGDLQPLADVIPTGGPESQHLAIDQPRWRTMSSKLALFLDYGDCSAWGGATILCLLPAACCLLPAACCLTYDFN